MLVYIFPPKSEYWCWKFTEDVVKDWWGDPQYIDMRAIFQWIKGIVKDPAGILSVRSVTYSQDDLIPPMLDGRYEKVLDGYCFFLVHDPPRGMYYVLAFRKNRATLMWVDDKI